MGVRRYPTFFPQRVNVRVPSMAMAGMVMASGDDTMVAEFGAPAALNSTGILAAQSVSAAGVAVTFAAAYQPTDAIMGRWGRCLRVVLSGAGTGNVVIRGRDYLNQRMQETIALNGATPVLGVKAFRYIDSITWPTVGAVTMDIGWRDCFGLPFRFKALVSELKNGIVTANAGTFVAGLATATAATATNADVRGTYLAATVIPDGTNTFEVRYLADNTNLHGNAQFFS